MAQGEQAVSITYLGNIHLQPVLNVLVEATLNTDSDTFFCFAVSSGNKIFSQYFELQKHSLIPGIKTKQNSFWIALKVQV